MWQVYSCLPHGQGWSGRCVYSTEGLRRSPSFPRLPLPSLRVLPSSVICQGKAERTKVADPHMSLARTRSQSCIRVRGGGVVCSGGKSSGIWPTAGDPVPVHKFLWAWCVHVTCNSWVIATRVRKTCIDFHCSKERRNPGFCIRT